MYSNTNMMCFQIVLLAVALSVALSKVIFQVIDNSAKVVFCFCYYNRCKTYADYRLLLNLKPNWSES